MEMREAIQDLLQKMPDERVREVLDFTRYLAQSTESEEWRLFGKNQLARAYGDDEPDYSEADIKPSALT